MKSLKISFTAIKLFVEHILHIIDTTNKNTFIYTTKIAYIKHKLSYNGFISASHVHDCVEAGVNVGEYVHHSHADAYAHE